VLKAVLSGDVHDFYHLEENFMKTKPSLHKTYFTGLIAASALVSASAFALELPLTALPGDADRDHWLPAQVNEPGKLEALQAATGKEATKYSGKQDRPIQIALIYPSADTSDFWARNYLALTKRLEQVGIEFETTEFASRQVEHSLQSTYATQVAQDADLYDYVIFGPSE
jgi:autoinducer 2-binding protein LuxP